MIEYREIFKIYAIRHACSSVAAILITGIICHLSPYDHTYWMILSAFMMCQTSRGAPLRQSLIMIGIMIATLIFADLVREQKQPIVGYISLIVIYFSTGVVIFTNRPMMYRHLVTLTLFMITFTIAVMQVSVKSDVLQNQLIDLMLGSMVGMACGVMILPIRVVEEFYDGLLDILELLRSYTSDLAEGYKNSSCSGDQQRLQRLHKMMLAKSNAYPEWVYDVGFNRFLRSSFRYYLIVIDRIIELLNSIELLNNDCADYELVRDYGLLFEDVMNQNHKIIALVIEYIKSKNISEISGDLVSDIGAIETALQSMIPPSLDLIELTPKFIKSTALVRDLRDLRDLLLRLVMALPINLEVKKKIVG